MKHIGPCILATVLLAASTARASVVTLVLNSPELYGKPGDVLAFFGTLTNTTSDVVWLNADNFNLPLGFGPGAIDDSPLFINTPSGYLAAHWPVQHHDPQSIGGRGLRRHVYDPGRRRHRVAGRPGVG